MADTQGSHDAFSLAFSHPLAPQAATAVRFVFGGALVAPALSAGEQGACGVPDVANAAQSIAPAGVPTHAVPAPSVARHAALVLALDADLPAHDGRNVAFVFGGAQLVTQAGAGDTLAVGAHCATIPWSVRPAGIAAPDIVPPVAADTRRAAGVLLALTEDLIAQDGRAVRFDFGDAARPVVAHGFDGFAAGTHGVEQPLGARAEGFDAARVGVPFVFAPFARDGNVDFAFGEALDAAPAASVRFDFGSGELLAVAEGFDACTFGAHSVEQPLSAQVEGFDAARVGTHVVRNAVATLRVRASGWDGAQTGQASVRNLHERIAPAGVRAPDCGEPDVFNRNQYIRAGNLYTPEDVPTRARVFNRNQYAVPAGWDAQAFGSKTLVSHFLRRIEARGVQPGNCGKPRVEHREKRIAPEGIFRDAVGFPVLGWARHLCPHGWDSARYLTRIIPEVSRVYPQGAAVTQWGAARIWNRQHVVAVPTLRPPGQEEFYYGRAHVWNLRQYIRQEFDVNCGLVPQPFGGWMRVENRNRVLGVPGYPQERFGYHEVFNAARPVLPEGIAPHGVRGCALVAHAVRRLALDGMEPPFVSYWLRVRNAARQLFVVGEDAACVGAHAVANTRRYYSRITAGNQQAFGVAFVADRVRTVSIESRYGIAPPTVRLPTVQLWTRYVEPQGWDAAAISGRAELRIHWNKIAPRWTHRELFGDAQVRNKTPQLYAHGICHDAFGAAVVDLFTRYVAPVGEAQLRIGRAGISHKTRKVAAAGLAAGAIGSNTRVTRKGSAPYSLQKIVLDGTHGYGIAPPGGTQQNVQVPEPILNQQEIHVINPEAATRFGVPFVAANSIRVEPGIGEDNCGTPFVSLRVRRLAVSPWQDRDVFEPERARLSPHTIYAVMDAPAQAKRNHPAPRTLHYVSGWAGFGLNTRVTLKNRTVRPYGYDMAGYGRARVEHWRRYILLAGWRDSRFGIPMLPGTRRLTQFNAPDGMTMGRPSVRIVWHGAQTIAPRGWAATAISERGNRVENLHRNIFPRGFLAQQMGASRSGDKRYMWQSLHVGAPDNPPMQGFDAACYGAPWVSHRIRDVRAEGFDAFLCEYDLMNFAARMRVRNAGAPKPAARTVAPVAIGACEMAMADARHLQYFIRPDGDSEQFRKGAF